MWVCNYKLKLSKIKDNKLSSRSISNEFSLPIKKKRKKQTLLVESGSPFGKFNNARLPELCPAASKSYSPEQNFTHVIRSSVFVRKLKFRDSNILEKKAKKKIFYFKNKIFLMVLIRSIDYVWIAMIWWVQKNVRILWRQRQLFKIFSASKHSFS